MIAALTKITENMPSTKIYTLKALNENETAWKVKLHIKSYQFSIIYIKFSVIDFILFLRLTRVKFFENVCLINLRCHSWIGHWYKIWIFPSISSIVSWPNSYTINVIVQTLKRCREPWNKRWVATTKLWLTSEGVARVQFSDHF